MARRVSPASTTAKATKAAKSGATTSVLVSSTVSPLAAAGSGQAGASGAASRGAVAASIGQGLSQPDIVGAVSSAPAYGNALSYASAPTTMFSQPLASISAFPSASASKGPVRLLSSSRRLSHLEQNSGAGSLQPTGALAAVGVGLIALMAAI